MKNIKINNDKLKGLLEDNKTLQVEYKNLNKEATKVHEEFKRRETEIKKKISKKAANIRRLSKKLLFKEVGTNYIEFTGADIEGKGSVIYYFDEESAVIAYKEAYDERVEKEKEAKKEKKKKK